MTYVNATRTTAPNLTAPRDTEAEGSLRHVAELIGFIVRGNAEPYRRRG